MMNFKTINYSFLVFAIMLIACDPKEENSVFDSSSIIVNLTDTQIIPAYDSVINRVKRFDTSLAEFETTPNEAALENMKEKWLQLALSWKTAEVFNFGPIKDMMLVSSIDNMMIDTAGINRAIEEYKGQADYLVSQGSNKKGIAAMEFILYEKKQELLSADKGQIILQYLNLLSADIASKINQVVASWKSDYQDQFIQSTGNSATSALTLVSNQLIFLSERLKNIKLGIPMAKMGVGTISPQKVEAPYSRTSLLLLKENVNTLKDVFNGGAGSGLDDYLKSLTLKDAAGLDLSDRINSQFDAVLVAIEQVNGDLYTAIEKQDPKLDDLYLELINLSIILKNDMMSQLGFLVMFSDNDGD